MANSISDSDDASRSLTKPAQYFVYFRCWPGFTEQFPYQQFGDLPDQYEGSLAIVRNALAKKVWESRDKYLARRKKRKMKTIEALRRQSNMVRGSGELPRRYKLPVSLRRTLYGTRDEWFLRLGKLVGWHIGRGCPVLDKTGRSWFFSPRIWLAVNVNQELAIGLVQELERLRHEGSFAGGDWHKHLNPRFAFIDAAHLSIADKASALSAITRIKEGVTDRAWEENAMSLMSSVDRYIESWAAATLNDTESSFQDESQIPDSENEVVNNDVIEATEVTTVSCGSIERGRKLEKQEHENRKLVYERYQEFKKHYKQHGFKNSYYRSAAEWMTDRHEDMAFLTKGIDDPSDFEKIGNRIKRMVRSFKQTSQPTNIV